MGVKFFIWSVFAVLAAGCSKPGPANSMTPDQTFQAYNQLVINGISFEDSKNYHSKAMVAKVEKQIKTMQKTNDNSFDAFIGLYLNSLQAAAKCAELTLASEKIEGSTAYLVYDRKDLCNGGQITSGGEEIRMVYEGRWKIDDNLSIYSD